MHRRKIAFIIFGLILILWSGCTNTSPTQQMPVSKSTSTPQIASLVQPLGSIPATCTPTPVYFGQRDNLATPWMKAIPSSSGIIGHLFFTQVTPVNSPKYYEPMHTHGVMPNGATTKILWTIQNASAIGEISITGNNLSRLGSHVQQTFVAASSGIPSIINVPTPGCWHFDLRSGTDQATATFWVLL